MAGGTRLLPLFAQEFDSFVQESGRQERVRVTGVGGSVEVDAFTLPELPIRMGGFAAVLQAAQSDSQTQRRRARKLTVSTASSLVQLG
ncbi:MAG: hypothetical protein AB1898_22050 [Acidobacteriota bacterium]